MSDLEEARLAKLRDLHILDSGDESQFDDLTQLTRRLLDCPIATITLVDSDRQWFKSRHEPRETSRDRSLCAYAIHHNRIMVVPDALNDPALATHPAVMQSPKVRFYAGVPLRPSMAGHEDDLPGIGALCVADTRPRILTGEEIALLRDLGATATRLIEARLNTSTAIDLAELLRARAEDAYRSIRQLRQAERLAGIGSWRLDLRSRTVEWSDNVFAIHGLPVGSRPTLELALSFYEETESARLLGSLDRCALTGEPVEHESNLIRADGAVRRVRSIGEAEYLDGQVVAIIGVFHDITDNYVRLESLRQSANTDVLTGLPNRAAIEREIDAAIRPIGNPEPLALVLIDLDGFKDVNDSFGHEAGDEVLRAVGLKLARLDPPAFAGRLGGDEFVVLLRSTREEVYDRLRSILDALSQVIERDGDSRTITATAGAALYAEGLTRQTLLRNADVALYRAKRQQKGTALVFSAAAACSL